MTNDQEFLNIYIEKLAEDSVGKMKEIVILRAQNEMLARKVAALAAELEKKTSEDTPKKNDIADQSSTSS